MMLAEQPRGALPQQRRRARRSSTPSSLTLMALGVFTLALAAAAVLYPGGSWTDPEAQRFSVLRNFWCDLLRSDAINGQPNGAAKRLASIGFAALGLAFLPFWPTAASVLPAQRRRPLIALGWLAAASLGAMVVLPSDRYPLMHGAVALAGGGLGMVCAWVCAGARLPGEPARSVRRVSGALAILLALLNAALYVHAAWGGGGETLWHPLVQKLATLALLSWMVSTTRAVQRRAWLSR